VRILAAAEQQQGEVVEAGDQLVVELGLAVLQAARAVAVAQADLRLAVTRASL